MLPNFRYQAKMDFEKAKNKAFLSQFISKVFQVNNELFQFEEVKYLLSPTGMVYRGIRSIPLEKIMGSEGRYNDFDRQFMPKQEHIRSRWENIDYLRLNKAELPPIQVYKIGDNYFVKDGNHRVSVARENEQEFIDAEVIELLSKLPLDKIRLDEKGLILAESLRYFLEKVPIDEWIPNANIMLTHPWGYYRLVEHINYYKYMVGLQENREIAWQDVVKKWYYDLYSPFLESIRNSKIMDRFPNRTEGDLYIWVMDHWHFLKQKYQNISFETALKDYSKKYGENRFYQWINKIKKSILKLLNGKKND